MKKLIFIGLFIIGVRSLAQTQFSNKYEASKLNSEISVIMENYVKQFGHKIQRSQFIDGKARERANYFLAVIEKKLDDGGDVYVLIDSIPSGSKAHNEQFGNPRYFRKPDSVRYIESVEFFKEQGISIDAEIMQESVWSFNEKKRIKDKNELCLKELEMLKKYIKTDPAENFLKNYERSPSHFRAIKKYGNGDFGTSTRVLITERKERNGTWTYNVIVYNVILFSSPL